MDTFAAALAKLSCTPVAGDLAFSALPDAPVLPVRPPSTFGLRRLLRRLDLSRTTGSRRPTGSPQWADHTSTQLATSTSRSTR
jgi:hypothetical protein